MTAKYKSNQNWEHYDKSHLPESAVVKYRLRRCLIKDSNLDCFAGCSNDF